ncbi:unnamed protein product [Linum trigynum]|uniref:Uncharacterized protein n=1 Tax=Linum trigynum TaxID=586398 RepID=A0AAV2F8Z1_9ROSI
MMQNFNRSRHCILSRLASLTKSHVRFQRLIHTVVEGTLPAEPYADVNSGSMVPQKITVDMSKWKKVQAKLYGITPYQIPDSPWTVLKILRYEGFEAYLVGGCVRDLILNRVPKDYDVITTANLSQIEKQFRNCNIVGRRFPICRVSMKGSVVEVSSFDTVAKDTEEKAIPYEMPSGCNKKDFILWRNSINRDFTINSLFFDPFKNVIYDYANGMEDLRALNLQTIIPARLSFQEDCARILRGLRIAGRLGLSLSPDTETAVHQLSTSIASLDKFRLMLEFNYMLAYGASEPTISLLQRFNLLGLFFPFHAAYLHQHCTENSPMHSMILMKLLFNLDNLVSCDQPCSCSLWLGVFAVHQALVIKPQDLSVILLFASVLHHGGWDKGLNFVREHSNLQVNFAPEISRFSESKSDDQLVEGVTRFACLVQECVRSFFDRDKLYEFMSRYPATPQSNMVFVSKKAGMEVANLFDALVKGNEFHQHKHGRKRNGLIIDYRKLGKGDVQETRFALGKIILETLSCGHADGRTNMEDEEAVIPVEGELGQTLPDLSKHRTVANEKRKRVISFVDDWISKQDSSKKLKLVDESLEQEGVLKKLKDHVIVEEGYRDEAGKRVKKVKDRRKVEKMKMERKRDAHIVLQDMVSERIERRSRKSKQASSVEETGRMYRLSSLFR